MASRTVETSVQEYAAAARLLSSHAAMERLAGVYLVAELGERDLACAKRSVDLLCAYLRVSRHLPHLTLLNHRRPSLLPREEFLVRTAITDRIRQNTAKPLTESAGPWSSLAFDFRGAILADLNLSNSVFTGEVNFLDVQLHGSTDFWSTRFHRAVDFSNVNFFSMTDFGGAVFLGPAQFVCATFHSETNFSKAEFFGPTDFTEAEFRDLADFASSRFAEGRPLDMAIFRTTHPGTN